jgi:PAS domain S-box-containing protein
VQQDPRSGIEWASFLVTRRGAIERALAADLGDALPPAGAAETEALRRFRSFAGARRRRADAGAPALDGLAVDALATARLVEAWCRAAAGVAGERGGELRALLEPLVARYRSALVGAELAHEARRAPRTARRAVAGAIDRIADAFLAIDAGAGTVADANPAAATLLRVAREDLLGRTAADFVAPASLDTWSEAIEALVESAAPHRFDAALVDAHGRSVAVDVRATRHATRGKVLALVVARVP